MNKKHISLVKIDSQTFEKGKFKTCLIPVDEYDIEVFKLIKVGDVSHCKIESDRKYSDHKHLFRVMAVCIENGIIEKMVNLGLIKEHLYFALELMLKNDIDILLHLIKWFNLPLIPNPDGTYSVNSIAYSNMGQLEFKEFKDKKVVPWLADIMGVTPEQLLLEAMR